MLVPAIILSVSVLPLQRSAVMTVELHAAYMRARLSAASEIARQSVALSGEKLSAEAFVHEPIEIAGGEVSSWQKVEYTRQPDGSLKIKSVQYSETGRP
jgi:hypothetical protein